MSNDYTYDEQGQFFPYFILTITGIITLPLTYSAFRRGKELENTAPRIRTDYKPSEADLIDEQKRNRKRRERKFKRIVFSGIGWLTMLYMVYLMIVTVRTVPKVWDPYDVLGISRVCLQPGKIPCAHSCRLHRRNKSSLIIGGFP
jgi:translocation protein SEC63